MISPTPRSLGYRMPAEWEPQEAVWLAWPHNPDTWAGDLLERVRQTYCEVIGALDGRQPEAAQPLRVLFLLRVAGGPAKAEPKAVLENKPEQ